MRTWLLKRHNQICPIREGRVTASKPASGAYVLQPRCSPYGWSLQVKIQKQTPPSPAQLGVPKHTRPILTKLLLILFDLSSESVFQCYQLIYEVILYVKEQGGFLLHPNASSLMQDLCAVKSAIEQCYHFFFFTHVASIMSLCF